MSFFQNAMLVIGFSEAEVVALYQLVAAVLKLGNIGFQHHNNRDGTDGAQLLNQHGMSSSLYSPIHSSSLPSLPTPTLPHLFVRLSTRPICKISSIGLFC